MFGTDHAVEDPVAGVEDAIARLADEDRSGWSGAARSDEVLRLVRTAERLQAEVLRAVGEWDGAAAWGEDGGLSPVAWLVHRAPLTKGGAARLVRSARLVRMHEPTAAALARGDVSVAHVEVMADTISRREDVFAEHGEVLLDAATRVVPEAFRTAARRWRSLADDVAATGDAFAVHERRFLSLAATFRGVGVGHFELDPDAYATVLSAVDSYAAPDRTRDPSPRRTLAQRRADALVEICSEILARNERTGRATTNTDTVIDLATLTGAPLVELTVGRCDITGFGPVARTTLERLLCDTRIGRVVLRGQSVVLDQGRRTPTVTPEQRRALAHRDGGCVFPGCDRPPTWTDAHHVEFWVRDDGPTDLDNLVLLCRRHHVRCHEGRWTLTRAPDGIVTATRPEGRARAPSSAA